MRASFKSLSPSTLPDTRCPRPTGSRKKLKTRSKFNTYHFTPYTHTHIFIYIYMCVCVGVCECLCVCRQCTSFGKIIIFITQPLFFSIVILQFKQKNSILKLLLSIERFEAQAQSPQPPTSYNESCMTRYA
jgi:hypothetical protein